MSFIVQSASSSRCGRGRAVGISSQDSTNQEVRTIGAEAGPEEKGCAVADVKRPRPSKNLAEQDKNSCRGMRLSNLTNGSQILPLVHLWTCRRLKIMGLQDSSVMC